MFCTQCGCKIEDGYRFCPKCGSAVAGQQESAKSDIDKIADEIYAECPNDFYGGIIELERRTKIGYKTANEMMFIRYHGKTEAQLKLQKKEFKHNKWKRNSGTDICPRCGSKYIDSYCRQGVSVTSETSLFGGMLITHPGDVKQGLKCLYCGYTWNPYKKK